MHQGKAHQEIVVGNVVVVNECAKTMYVREITDGIRMLTNLIFQQAVKSFDDFKNRYSYYCVLRSFLICIIR